MRKLVVILSAVGLVLVATVSVLLFLPDFPGFLAGGAGQGLDLDIELDLAATQPLWPVSSDSEPNINPEQPDEDYQEYRPQTILEFLAQNPVPEGFVADNAALPWYLKLVNRYNVMDEDFEENLAYIGQRYFDARAAQALLAMIDYAWGLGLEPMVTSAHRGIGHQRWLFNNQVERNIHAGMNPEEAFEEARRVVAYPGTSEHNLGLAVDVVVRGNYSLTYAFGQTPEGEWLAQNAHYFGFVLRYPDHKQHITNIIYEPWHFRYVGRHHAQVMFENDIVLEEYIFWKQSR